MRGFCGGWVKLKSGFMDLENILDIQKWQTLQDSLALVTKMAIITVDYKGIPITTHSHPCRFCQFVRSDPELLQYCYKCDSRGGLEAVRLNAPYIYLCHCNIIDIAIPIMIDGKYIGALMAGEVRLPKNEEAKLEKILISPSKNIFKNKEAARMYKDIPMSTYAEVRQCADMLFSMSNYIVEEAINKNHILEMYGNIANINVSGESDSNNPSGLRQIRKALGDAVTNAYIKTTSENRMICKNRVLRPAFEYIYENKGKSISQKQMADICHISASHFSRLFAREVGEGFSTFLSRLKVQWSKQLLEKTDLSITQISEELGFSDSGYFIKIFRKYENITPAVYRSYYLDAPSAPVG